MEFSNIKAEFEIFLITDLKGFNMKFKIFTTTCLIFFASTSSNLYANDIYSGAHFSSIDINYSEISAGTNFTVFSGRIGKRWNKNISSELRLGFGVGDDMIGDYIFKVRNLFGAYLKAGIPVSYNFYPYVIIGQTRGKFSKFDIWDGEVLVESDSGASFGAGADYNISNASSLNIEFLKYMDLDDKTDLSGLSIGLAKKF